MCIRRVKGDVFKTGAAGAASGSATVPHSVLLAQVLERSFVVPVAVIGAVTSRSDDGCGSGDSSGCCGQGFALLPSVFLREDDDAPISRSDGRDEVDASFVAEMAYTTTTTTTSEKGKVNDGVDGDSGSGVGEVGEIQSSEEDRDSKQASDAINEVRDEEGVRKKQRCAESDESSKPEDQSSGSSRARHKCEREGIPFSTSFCSWCGRHLQVPTSNSCMRCARPRPTYIPPSERSAVPSRGAICHASVIGLESSAVGMANDEWLSARRDQSGLHYGHVQGASKWRSRGSVGPGAGAVGASGGGRSVVVLSSAGACSSGGGGFRGGGEGGGMYGSIWPSPFPQLDAHVVSLAIKKGLAWDAESDLPTGIFSAHRSVSSGGGGYGYGYGGGSSKVWISQWEVTEFSFASSDPPPSAHFDSTSVASTTTTTCASSISNSESSVASSSSSRHDQSNYYNCNYSITYQISGSRYCRRVAREHKSNHIMFEVNLQRGFAVQKCWDPDCRGYRSPPIYIYSQNILPLYDRVVEVIDSASRETVKRREWHGTAGGVQESRR
jgi:hypothetical protein